MTSKPDVNALMKAYGVLDVQHAASAGEIRRAYRLLAYYYHPDRHQGDPEDLRDATLRMTAINDAYRLIRYAPLRGYNAGRQACGDRDWTQAEMDRAVRRARSEGLVEVPLSVTASGAVGVIVSLTVVRILASTGMPIDGTFEALIVVVCVAACAVLGSRATSLWWALEALLLLSRLG